MSGKYLIWGLIYAAALGLFGYYLFAFERIQFIWGGQNAIIVDDQTIVDTIRIHNLNVSSQKGLYIVIQHRCIPGSGFVDSWFINQGAYENLDMEISEGTKDVLQKDKQLCVMLYQSLDESTYDVLKPGYNNSGEVVYDKFTVK